MPIHHPIWTTSQCKDLLTEKKYQLLTFEKELKQRLGQKILICSSGTFF